MKVAAGASAAASLLLLALPQAASAGLIAPESPASPQASSTSTIYWVLLIILIVSVLGVAALFLRSLRARAGDGDPGPEGPSEAAERSMQFRVGGALTVTALLLFVVGIFFTNDASIVDADQSDADPITIQVEGQQWLWRYGYPVEDPSADGFNPDAAYSYYELVIPVDTPINLDVGSIDVMHRLSIPALGVAVDAVPGTRSEASFVADEVGTYEGRSTRFSGGGFPTMRTVVHVVEPDEYEQFLSTRSEEIKAGRDAVGERVEAGTAPGVEVEVEE